MSGTVTVAGIPIIIGGNDPMITGTDADEWIEGTDADNTIAGFGGNDVDGILSTEYVADCILAGIQQERFLVLPHHQVSSYFQRKAENHDRWISGMRRFRRKLAGENK